MKYVVRMWNVLKSFFGAPETSSSQSTTERKPLVIPPLLEEAGAQELKEWQCGWRPKEGDEGGDFVYLCFCGMHGDWVMPPSNAGTITSTGTLEAFRPEEESTTGDQVAAPRVKPLNSRERKEKARAEKLAMPHRQFAGPGQKEVQ